MGIKLNFTGAKTWSGSVPGSHWRRQGDGRNIEL